MLTDFFDFDVPQWLCHNLAVRREPNAIYFENHSRRSLRERNVNLEQNVGIFELHATFAERMATLVVF